MADDERVETTMTSTGDGGAQDGPPATRLPSISRLRGMDVCDADGERIGTVRDAFLDPTAERLRYLAVSVGRLSRATHAVPIEDVTYVDDGAEEYAVVPYSAEHLRGAPGLEGDGAITPARERAIEDHYARSAEWEAARESVRARQTTPAPTPQIAEAVISDAIAQGEDPPGARARGTQGPPRPPG
jgi:sporulation protein YlmC with PRC-barrel domain